MIFLKIKIKKKVKELDYELSGKQTNGFLVFNFNLIKIMAILYMTFFEDSFENITEMETKDYFPKIPFEFIITAMITNLEVYLRKVFIDILSYFEYPKLNESYKKILHIDDQKLNKYLKDYDEKYFPTQDIIKLDELKFQNKDNIKDYFKIININITRIINNFDQTLWGKLFGGEEDNPGYLELRHNLVHKGSVYAKFHLGNLDIAYIENLILDITKFIYAVEKFIIVNFPNDKEYARIYFG